VTILDKQRRSIALSAASYPMKPIDRERLLAILSRLSAASAGGSDAVTLTARPVYPRQLLTYRVARLGSLGPIATVPVIRRNVASR
jgi:hypothetical protein